MNNTVIVLNAMMKRALLLFLLICVLDVCAQSYPAWYSATTNLNIRAAGNKYGNKIATVSTGTRLKVISIRANGWAQVEYNGRTAYCDAKYLSYREPVYIKQSDKGNIPGTSDKNDGVTLWNVVEILIYVLVAYIVLSVLRYLLIIIMGFLSSAFYYGYIFVSFPFYYLNLLQRFLAKPWFLFYKRNSRNDSENERLLEAYEYWKIPCYIILTPLRFVNAVYYNLVVHCSFELINYLIEIILPTNSKEGGDDSFILWTVMLPWRIMKYLLWHGSLTLIESGVWTIVDTFVPALTLFHGTDPQAAEMITQGPGRVCTKDWYSGVWKVGGGYYAGNGIYFAPKRQTALHYSSGSLIVCRVSLGRTLDLGLAPKRIYDLCGKPDALGVTDWGLKNGYVTGEWWRGDPRAQWWEYCMYDWQRKYNDSWRIRPLYVINLSNESIQRIPGGMVHWLFNKMVLHDLSVYLEKEWG